MINGWSLHPEQVVTGPGATEGRIDEIRIVPQGMNREGTEEHVGIELRASTSGLSIDAEDVVIGWDDAVAAGTLPKRDDATRPVPPTDAARLLAITALFPDPTSGDITILLDDDRKRDGLAVIVTDMSGREVLRVTDAMPSGAEDGRIVVATDDLDAGTYHCTVRSGGESATRSFRVVR